MKPILLSILSALLLILCFPRFDIEYLAWFALVPLLIAIKGKGLKSAFGLCFLAGMISNPGVFYWFRLVKGVGWTEFILIDIYLSFCYFGLFGLGLNLVTKKTRLPSIVTAPVLWVTLEYARSYAGIVAHPEMLMSHSQYLNLPIIQISAFTGAYGVSFLIVMVNVAISDLIHNRSRAFKPIIATIIVLGISLAYGFSVIPKEPGKDTVSITVIQPNIPQAIKWKPEFREQHLRKHVRLSKEASNNGNASLIIWPEASVQYFRHDLYALQTISTLARNAQTYLLFGSSENPKYGSMVFRKKNSLNSAFLVSPGGKIKEQYNRIHLVPFTEYVPYKDSFPWPSRLVSKAGNFISGTEYTIFNLDEAKFGVVICTENTFPSLFRQFVKRGANFMVNIGNEARLGETTAPHQLAAISVFRAVENRTAIARSINTGISCFIDPHGKIMGRVHDHNNKSTFVEGYLTKEIPLSHKKTFYTKYGDVFVYMNLIMAAFMFALCFFKSKYSAAKA